MARKEILLGNYIVNENSSPYVIAEIGINHNGDLQIAKKLIDAANACGCANYTRIVRKCLEMSQNELKLTIVSDLAFIYPTTEVLHTPMFAAALFTRALNYITTSSSSTDRIKMKG